MGNVYVFTNIDSTVTPHRGKSARGAAVRWSAAPNAIGAAWPPRPVHDDTAAIPDNFAALTPLYDRCYPAFLTR